MLDSTAEQVQHGKKQRERLLNDEIYFISGNPPQNAPTWAIGKNVYEMDETDYDVDLPEDDPEDDGFEDTNLGYFESDFINNSTEMNFGRPEDQDEVGESSTSRQVSQNDRSKLGAMIVL